MSGGGRQPRQWKPKRRDVDQSHLEGGVLDQQNELARSAPTCSVHGTRMRWVENRSWHACPEPGCGVIS